MCGIVGILDPRGTLSLDRLAMSVRRMADALYHRGPDDEGQWLDPAAGVAFGHRRLSILDLSPQGRQPMISHSGRRVLVFNGEVYNFAEIRAELEQDRVVPWRGHSDTEIMLEAMERWGVAGALKRFNGMFSVAVWDREKRTLTLARDRLGKKPLYYGWLSGCLVFGSELGAVKAAGLGTLAVNRAAIACLLRLNYIPAPSSIYVGINKLQAASIVVFDEPALASRRMPETMAYWSARQAIEDGQTHAFHDEGEAKEQLDALLANAVGLRMVADVPLGAFLSGGIDSSVVVAYMQRLISRPVKTYAIGFHAACNEADHAKAVAAYLGTEHTELYLTEADVIDLIPRLPELTDEPHGDTAVLPTYLVSRLARKNVTVSLSGDGGDELFAGYPRYLWMQDHWLAARRRGRFLPAGMRRVVGRWLAGVRSVARVRDLGQSWSMASPEEVWYEFVSHCRNPGDLLADNRGGTDGRIPGLVPLPESIDPVQRMVYMDLMSRLPDSIVSKVDRTTMKVSLEARAPLMDYRLAELSARIPISSKIRNGQGKWILRQLLYQQVPRELVDRPKKGFKMPISDWLRGPLRDWAEDLLAENRLRREGIFQVDVVRAMWQAHLGGKSMHHYCLWDILSFQAWFALNR